MYFLVVLSEGWKSEVKVPVWLRSCESFLAAFLLCVHMGWVRWERADSKPSGISSYKNTNSTMTAPPS